MARTVYDVVMMRTVDGKGVNSVVATIDGDKITGPKADWVRETIQAHYENHPEEGPEIIFSGMYCWAEKRIVPLGPA
jgi:hypothetical protein